MINSSCVTCNKSEHSNTHTHAHKTKANKPTHSRTSLSQISNRDSQTHTADAGMHRKNTTGQPKH